MTFHIENENREDIWKLVDEIIPNTSERESFLNEVRDDLDNMTVRECIYEDVHIDKVLYILIEMKEF